jgi:hypothetical protein
LCKKVNCILSLENDARVRVTDGQGICQLAKGYFEELFLESNSDCAPVLEAIDNVVSGEDNVCSTATFQVQEFKEAMYSMHPDKWPGPDGFNQGFFSNFGQYVILIFLVSVVLGLTIISFHLLLTLLMLP